jgi:protease-4
MTTNRRDLLKQLGAIGLGVIAPLAIGCLLAVWLIPVPMIGIIYFRADVTANSAGSFTAQVEYARSHPEVRAVVLVLDSPGGEVTASDTLYQAVLSLRQSKPVVTTVEYMAASAAYHLAAATDYIYARPSSEIGSVGVIGPLPNVTPSVNEEYGVTTGPYKGIGDSRDSRLRKIDLIKQVFVKEVLAGRGARLNIDVPTLLSGRTWLGTEALRLGLIDGIGAQNQAIGRAAQLAHIANYGTIDLAGATGRPILPSVLLDQVTSTPAP